MEPVRRVTTGKNSAGTSVVVEDTEVDAVTVGFLPGVEFLLLGGGDEPPDVGLDARAPVGHGFFPGESGYRVIVSTIPASTTVRASTALDKKAVLAELDEKLPGLLAASEKEPGMHTSHTLDFVLILEGEVTLELDDGVKLDLNKGDFVTQMGARHRWSNRGERQAVILSMMVGASGALPFVAKPGR
jgi:mannose-6-phosphate isomerase-like protein (cupin superfamily)